ncbi:hypothetical protein [Arthrobacter sp. D5-1]|uniref:hypothetical protein n=1 Tax=Arthrobacter sp. D5-1 TaxID=1477518 RepID=UPI001A98218F|nr:hypothetical protein [Arthrobacter sp. D5-1]QSZ51265.1 hypothetical protein AYX22_22255 [Arthrobacter sp. D5-1]QSZ55606.1 hypothetical protein AYX19_21160 [Paenarthrobacter ureafaciens]
MKHDIQHDWTAVQGESVEIYKSGQLFRAGVVDTVTDDGEILWILGEGIMPRTMFERSEGYEVWAAD